MASTGSATTQKYEVVVFLSARCPCSASHESVLKELHSKYSAQVVFTGIHANADEPQNESAQHFSAAALPFKVLEDTQGQWIARYPAVKTPHAYLVDTSTGKILYQGGVTGSHHGPTASEHPLEEAIAATLAGKEIPKTHGRILGCAIARRKP